MVVRKLIGPEENLPAALYVVASVLTLIEALPQIAKDLFVEPSTVKTHVGKVLSKLSLRDRVAAVIWAYEIGLVRPGGRRPRGRRAVTTPSPGAWRASQGHRRGRGDAPAGLA